jgi:hypothetical protein
MVMRCCYTVHGLNTVISDQQEDDNID